MPVSCCSKETMERPMNVTEVMDGRNAESIRTARTDAAWIDRSDIGIVTMTGADRLDLLQRLTTNDLSGVKPMVGAQTVLLTEKARIIDVVTVLDDGSTTTLLTSVGTPPDIVKWLRKYIIMDDVRVKESPDLLDLIEVCGPRSSAVVKELVGVDVSGVTKYNWLGTDDGITIVRLPSPCDVSYLLFGSTASMSGIRASVMDNPDIIPSLTSEEEEFLRIVGGFGKMGHEWTDAYNPLEAGLIHLVSFAKGCYIGQEVVARLDSYNKVKQRVMILVGSQDVGTTDPIVADGVEIGKVTSVTKSLDGAHVIALGYVRGEHAHENTTIKVRTESGEAPFTLHLPPLEA